eukprot:TRINITY_DN102256_c0_g1_i1.p1 TRINITY_DN102256_c0_g1~~TRINITY_DN102256_c0_g1_i1.p1  ORF type:complete len:514 (-),score=65.59 TRINITY_DN102256_c0_g1_i1:234-1613(-)
MAGATAIGVGVASGSGFVPRPPTMLEDKASLEKRVRSLEARLNLMQKDGEELRAIEILKKDAAEHGLDISDGIIRRTSSRFCLGVEHGDYNGTELFGVGTDRFIWMAYKPNKSGKVRIYSHNFPGDGVIEYVPGKVPKPQSPEISDTWARFSYGVDHTLRQAGYPTGQGFDAVVVGNIPGGGMSRSASLIINLLLTTMEVNGTPMPEGDFKAVTLSHKVETEYVGTPCGQLDQIMIYFAKEGMGTRYDPKSGKITYVPLGLSADEFRIAALDTGTVRHGLEKSTYAVRVKECQALVKMLKAKGYAVNSLADVREDKMYKKVMSECGSSEPDMCKRLTYIYNAQKRFEAMVKAWEQGDIEEVGSIFRRDGIGLRDEYVISGPELESMCDVARTVPGVLGERMLGGGDKGAAGAILQKSAVAALREAVEHGYKRAHPEYADKCAVHVVKVCQGVERMEGLL